MTLCAVISTKGRPDELSRCLKSLEGQSRIPDELVVVDADSDPRIREIVREQESRISSVGYHALPSSLTQARNHAIRHSKGDIVVFLDDDLILEPDFLKEIARPLEEDPGIAGVTGNITNHPRDAAGFNRMLKVFFLLPCDGDGRFRISGAPTTTCGLGEARGVEFVPGGLTAWRRGVFEEFLFDETLPGLGINEDVDFSYRVSRKWKNYYTPRARTTHERPASNREGSLRYLRMEMASYWHLYRKNQPKDPLHFAAFLWHDIGILIRFMFRRWLRA